MSISVDLLNEAIISGFLLGLSTGPLCMGTCLPVLIPFSVQNSASNIEKYSLLKFVCKFLTGRFIAYIIFGLGVGYIGSIFQSSIINKISLIIIFGLALLMIAYGMGAKFSHYGFCKTAFAYSRSKKFPFILGILTGVNLCAPFLLAIFYSFERSTTPLFGIMFFAAFFFSTSLFLIPVLLVKYLPKGNYLFKISQATALLVGVFFIYKGITLLL